MSDSGEMRVKLRVLYGGKFELNARKKLVYKNQKQCKLDPIDPDLISKVVLEDTFQIDISLPKPVKEFWYLELGKAVDNGLRRVDDDRDSMEMLNYSDKGKWIHVYVVQDGEFGPYEVKNKISAIEVQTSIVAEIVSEDPNLNASINPHAPRAAIIEDTTFEDGAAIRDDNDECFRVLGSESSNDMSDFSDKEGLEDEELWEEGLEVPNIGEEPKNLVQDPQNLVEEPENLVQEHEHLTVPEHEDLGEVPGNEAENLGEMAENMGEMAENYGQMDENFAEESMFEENLDSEFPHQHKFKEFNPESDFNQPIVFSRG